MVINDNLSTERSGYLLSSRKLCHQNISLEHLYIQQLISYTLSVFGVGLTFLMITERALSTLFPVQQLKKIDVM